MQILDIVRFFAKLYSDINIYDLTPRQVFASLDCWGEVTPEDQFDEAIDWWEYDCKENIVSPLCLCLDALCDGTDDESFLLRLENELRRLRTRQNGDGF